MKAELFFETEMVKLLHAIQSQDAASAMLILAQGVDMVNFVLTLIILIILTLIIMKRSI